MRQPPPTWLLSFYSLLFGGVCARRILKTGRLGDCVKDSRVHYFLPGRFFYLSIHSVVPGLALTFIHFSYIHSLIHPFVRLPFRQLSISLIVIFLHPFIYTWVQSRVGDLSIGLICLIDLAGWLVDWLIGQNSYKTKVPSLPIPSKKT